MSRLSCLFALCLLLGGCATRADRLPATQQVLALADDAQVLQAFGELALRHRDSYERLRPYLDEQQDASEKLLDRQRRAMHADVALIELGVAQYLQGLGQLARQDRFAFTSEINAAGVAIRAWPATGIDDRAVTAYTILLRLLARMQGEAGQRQLLGQLMRDGDPALQTLVSTLTGLLRLYDKAGDNERDIVLGLLETDIAFADTPAQRLLAVLAKTVQQSKIDEYRLYGLRHTLAQRQLAALALEHARLASLGELP
ncbi:hypothetical protein [Janthinobacterium psychrotolerans]|uniref:Lipoprotein n=1 Tax=Janthinobacterium psychrotolerans TaxID=1747903 RepID=A0A1A7C5W4_9BURK|nr:hypothetical protein [Janthinobacterium psychrotolerans]OBV40150.1 hypothetical protein ASR47_101465 [Janthinobacterium psychrotolerans]